MLERHDDVQAAYARVGVARSSRVLMIGRLRVVADDTPSQMCRLVADAVHGARGRLQHLAGAA